MGEKVERKIREREGKCMHWVSKGFPIWTLAGSALGLADCTIVQGRERMVGIVGILGEIAGFLLVLRGQMGRIRARVRFFLAVKLTLFWSSNCRLLQNLRFSSLFLSMYSDVGLYYGVCVLPFYIPLSFVGNPTGKWSGLLGFICQLLENGGKC